MHLPTYQAQCLCNSHAAWGVCSTRDNSVSKLGKAAAWASKTADTASVLAYTPAALAAMHPCDRGQAGSAHLLAEAQSNQRLVCSLDAMRLVAQLFLLDAQLHDRRRFGKGRVPRTRGMLLTCLKV